MDDKTRLADMTRLMGDAEAELKRLLRTVGLMESLTAASGAIVASINFIAEQKGANTAIQALQGQVRRLEQLRDDQNAASIGRRH